MKRPLYTTRVSLCVFLLGCCCSLQWEAQGSSGSSREGGVDTKARAVSVTCSFEGLLGADAAAADVLNSSPAATRMQNNCRVECLFKLMTVPV